MKVILLKNIKKIGSFASRITVKPGFARNFLLKKNKAIRATPENIKFFTQEEQKIKKNYISNKNNALKDFQYLSKRDIFYYFANVTNQGKLYGAISKKEILRRLSIKLFSKNISLYIQKKIKHTGIFNVNVILHPEIKTNIKLIVGENKNKIKCFYKKNKLKL